MNQFCLFLIEIAVKYIFMESLFNKLTASAKMEMADSAMGSVYCDSGSASQTGAC